MIVILPLRNGCINNFAIFHSSVIHISYASGSVKITGVIFDLFSSFSLSVTRMAKTVWFCCPSGAFLVPTHSVHIPAKKNTGWVLSRENHCCDWCSVAGFSGVLLSWNAFAGMRQRWSTDAHWCQYSVSTFWICVTPVSTSILASPVLWRHPPAG